MSTIKMVKKSNHLLAGFATVILFLITSGYYRTHAQNENNVWVYGHNMGIDFNSSIPQLIRTALHSVEAGASVSDPVTGQLLFYTDGTLCWNRNHQRMPNGAIPLSRGLTDTLGTAQTTAQGTVIVPVPGNQNRYYIFSLEPMAGYVQPAYNPRASRGALYYSIADMTLDGGRGDLVAGAKGMLIDTGYSEAMVAVMGSCSDYWLIVHLVDTPVFHAYHITATGVDPAPVISQTGSQIRGLGSYAFTYMDASPDGHMLAVTSNNPRKGEMYMEPPVSMDCDGVLLCRFDPVSGQVSDAVLLSTEPSYGVCFSPANSKLYACHSNVRMRNNHGPIGRRIYQYEINPCYDPDSAVQIRRHLLDTDSVNSPHEGWSQFKRFRGKVYISSDKYVLNQPLPNVFNCIQEPDLAGMAAGFEFVCQQSSLRDTGDNTQNYISRIGLPPNVLTQVNVRSGRDTVYSSRQEIFCFRDSGVLDIPCNIGWQPRWADGYPSLKRPVARPDSTCILTYYGPGCKFHIDTIHVIFSGTHPVTGTGGACSNGKGGTAWIIPPPLDPDSYIYRWMKSGDTIQTGYGSVGNGDTLYTSDTGVYQVYYETLYGCGDFVELTITSLSRLLAFDVDSVVCAGSPVQFKNRSTGNFSAWVWDFGDGDSATQFSPEHMYDQPGNYLIRLIAANGNHCNDTVYHALTVDSLPYLYLNPDRDHICAGETVHFQPVYRSGADSLVWEWAEGQPDQVVPLTYSFATAGTYPLTVTAAYNPCRDTMARDTIYVAPLPLVHLGTDSSLCPGDALRLANQESGQEGDQHRWSTGASSAMITVQTPGMYWLQVISENECTVTDSITIYRSCYIDLPNVFTPNGDGLNDHFFPGGLQTRGVTSFHMQVFNRWGQLMYESRNIADRGWDGRFNGQIVQEGVYVYQISAGFRNGAGERYQGNVTLLK